MSGCCAYRSGWAGCSALHHRVGLVRSVTRKDDMGFVSEVANH
jgi:hypothetical protein